MKLPPFFPFPVLTRHDILYREIVDRDTISNVYLKDGKYYLSGHIIKSEDEWEFLKGLTILSFYVSQEVGFVEVTMEDAAYTVATSLFTYCKPGTIQWIGYPERLCPGVDGVFEKLNGAPEDFQIELYNQVIQILEDLDKAEEEHSFSLPTNQDLLDLMIHTFEKKLGVVYVDEESSESVESTNSNTEITEPCSKTSP